MYYALQYYYLLYIFKKNPYDIFFLISAGFEPGPSAWKAATVTIMQPETMVKVRLADYIFCFTLKLCYNSVIELQECNVKSNGAIEIIYMYKQRQSIDIHVNRNSFIIR
jgi:hypothetical protein